MLLARALGCIRGCAPGSDVRPGDSVVSSSPSETYFVVVRGTAVLVVVFVGSNLGEAARTGVFLTYLLRSIYEYSCTRSILVSRGLEGDCLYVFPWEYIGNRGPCELTSQLGKERGGWTLLRQIW